MAAGARGNVSATETAVRATAFGFDRTRARRDVPPGRMEAGEKDLDTVGRARTVTAHVAGASSVVASVVSIRVLPTCPVTLRG
jgi:hypothetical protein